MMRCTAAFDRKLVAQEKDDGSSETHGQAYICRLLQDPG